MKKETPVISIQEAEKNPVWMQSYSSSSIIYVRVPDTHIILNLLSNCNSFNTTATRLSP